MRLRDRWAPTGAVKTEQNVSTGPSSAPPAALTSAPARVEWVNVHEHTSTWDACSQWPCTCPTLPPQHTRSQHTTVLGVSICHVRKNLQSFPVCRGLRLTAFLWKFMSQQLWSHPPVQTLKTTASQELRGDPIHYTPPGNFSERACMYAHVSHLLGVSEHPSAWLTVSAFLPPRARSCPTSCSFDCQHVCKNFCIHLAEF